MHTFARLAAAAALTLTAAAALAAPTYLLQRTDGPISVDGVLDESTWAKAAPTSPLRDLSGGPSDYAADIRMAYDDTCLYVAARLPAKRLRASLTERDAVATTTSRSSSIPSPAVVTTSSWKSTNSAPSGTSSSPRPTATPNASPCTIGTSRA